MTTKRSYDDLPIMSRTVDTYHGERFTVPSFEKTRELIDQNLSEIRVRLKLPDNEEFVGLPKTGGRGTCYRDGKTYGDTENTKTLSIHTIERNNYPEGEPANCVWMIHQNDFYSCSAASIFTCTAGYCKIEPGEVEKVHNNMKKLNLWGVGDGDTMPDLPVEGLTPLLYGTYGILPVILFGKVKHPDEGLHKGLPEISIEDNCFNDKERFLKMMRLVRFASICCSGPHHWYSLVCIPRGNDLDDTQFIICDSLSHDKALLYGSYESLHQYFFREKTCRTYAQHIRPLSPLTIAFYPTIQEGGNPSREVNHFMETVLKRTLFNMEKDRMPFFYWPDMIQILDSLL